MSATSDSRGLRALLAAAIFVGAFLLFLVQPMVARVLLPRFGGAASVWTVCMLFFQTLLLAGYLLAHLIATRRSFVQQAVLFALLAVGALAFLRPEVLLERASESGGAPESQILFALLLSIGAPYALLSIVSPLLQRWVSTLEDSERFYRLYALSNLGSLLALLLYPVLVERVWGARTQLALWSGGFTLQVLLLLGCALLIGRAHRRSAKGVQSPLRVDGAPPPGAARLVTWWALSFLGCVALLSFTNFITTDVAPVPLLWVLPLALYLITFIIVFERERPIPREALFVLTYGLILGVADNSITGLHSNMIISGVYLLVTLFCCCLVCHGELALRRPPRGHLTLFYLILSLGGCCGGIFVGLIAPRVFSAYREFPLTLVGVLAILALSGRGLLALHVPPLRGGRAAAAAGVLFLFGVLTVSRALFVDPKHPIESARNFYGVLRIVDVHDPDVARRTMYHGRVNHGTQLSTPGLDQTPTAYFAEGSGAWIATSLHKANEPRRIGILGLGAGVIATHGRPGDRIEYYEINPLVEKLARKYFTFLSGSKADVSVEIGDGRLILERSAPKNLDILILDAFSGDAIPSHLLTRESFQEYLRQLAPDGLLVLHISNQHLDLEPVVWGIARELGLHAAFFFRGERPKPYHSRSYYMILSRTPDFLARPDVQPLITRSAPAHPPGRTWTDDWVDLVGAIRLGGKVPPKCASPVCKSRRSTDTPRLPRRA